MFPLAATGGTAKLELRSRQYIADPVALPIILRHRRWMRLLTLPSGTITNPFRNL